MRALPLILAAGSGMALAVPAQAQDRAPFTGARVEGILGYDITKAGSSVDNDASQNDDESIVGLLYGVGVGYDFNMGSAVVGVEGDFTDGTAKTRFNNPTDPENVGLGRVETGRDMYIGARAGIWA